MPTIRGGFTTKNKNEMLQKIKDSGAELKMNFKASSKLSCKVNEFDGFNLKDFEGNEQIIEIIEQEDLWQ